MAEAAAKADEILRRAIQSRDEQEWTRALIRGLQLRIGPARLRDRGALLAGAAVARGAAVAHDARALLRARADRATRRLLLGDQSARAGRVRRGAPVDLKAWTREQIFAEAERAYRKVWLLRRSAVGAAGRPAGRVPEVEQLSQERARHAARRRVVPLRRAARRHARSGRRRSPTASSGWTSGPCSRRTGETRTRAWPIRRRTRSSRSRAILDDLETWHAGRGRARGRARGAPGEAAPPACRPLRLLRPRRDPRGSREAPAALSGAALVGRWAWPSCRSVGRPWTRPDNLVRAREAAQEGLRAYPDSVGGRVCRRPDRRASSGPTFSSRRWRRMLPTAARSR